MNPSEREIIAFLRHGKRVNMSDIARKLNLPVSTVTDRIRRIENKYVIKRASLLDYAKAGYPASALIILEQSCDDERLVNFLKKENCVNTVYRINSGYSYMIEVIFKDPLELIIWTDGLKKEFSLELSLFQILKIEAREKFMP